MRTLRRCHAYADHPNGGASPCSAPWLRRRRLRAVSGAGQERTLVSTSPASCCGNRLVQRSQDDGRGGPQRWRISRTPIWWSAAPPLSKLKLGVKCAAARTAFPAFRQSVIGEVSDRVVTLGGGSALAEFPELCGVEANMISRCIRSEDKARFLERCAVMEAAANACGLHLPTTSPGNPRRLITDAIKSAGAAKKAARPRSAPCSITRNPCRTPGCPRLYAGNDVEAVTGSWPRA